MNKETVCSGGKLWQEVIRESGGFISLVQLLIQPEDIGLIVDLWTDKLSPPTLLPPFSCTPPWS